MYIPEIITRIDNELVSTNGKLKRIFLDFLGTDVEMPDKDFGVILETTLTVGM